MFQCDECGNQFDPNDKRASLSNEPRYPTLCPLCTFLRYHGSQAWAVWNSCQGIFDDAVRSRKSEAEEIMHAEYVGVADKVVPVRIYVEPEHQHDYREWADRQLD